MGRSNINLVGNTTEGQNVGIGEGIYIGKLSGNSLQYKTLSITGTTMSICSDADNIYFSANTGGASYWSSGATGLYPSAGESIDLNTKCVYWNSGVYMVGSGVGATGEIALKTNDLGYNWRFNKSCFGRGVSGDFQINVHPFGVATCGIQYAFTSEPNSGLGQRYDSGHAVQVTLLSDNGCRHLYMHDNDMYIESDDVYFKSLPACTTETNVIYVDASGKISSGATGGGTPTGRTCSVAVYDGAGDLGDSNLIYDQATGKLCHSGSTFSICARCGDVVSAGGAGMYVCAGGNYASGANSAGDLTLSAGDNNASASGGQITISPGIQANTGTVGQINLGKLSYTSTNISLRVQGTQTNIGLGVCPKGTGALTLGCSTSANINMNAAIIQTGSLAICNSASKISWYLAQDAYICGSRGATNTEGCALHVKGGCGYPSSNCDGGNLILCGGTPDGIGSTGNIIIPNLPAYTTETNVIYIDASGNLSSGATGGGSSYWSSGATGLYPTNNESILLAANSPIQWSGVSTYIKGDANNSIIYHSGVEIDGTPSAHIFDTQNNLCGAGRIASFRDVGGEKFAILQSGQMYIPSGSFQFTIGGGTYWQICDSYIQRQVAGGPALKNTSSANNAATLLPYQPSTNAGVGGTAGVVTLTSSGNIGVQVDTLGNAYLPKISGETTANVVYINTTTGLLTYGAGGTTISGTTGYVARFNATCDDIEDSSIFDTGTTTIQIKKSCMVVGSPVGTLTTIKANDHPTSQSSLILQPGTCLGYVSGHQDGYLYLNPGRGVPYHDIRLGSPTFDKPNIFMKPYGTGTNMSFYVEAKGTSGIIGFEAGSSGSVYVGPSQGQVIFGCGGLTTMNHSCDWTIRGRNNSQDDSDGKNLTLCAGGATGTGTTGGCLVLQAGAGTVADGRIIMTGLPACTTETCTVFIDASGNLSTGVGGGGTPLGWSCATNGGTSVGVDALPYCIDGTSNTAFGVGALKVNTTGDNNTALGAYTLYDNTIGLYNVAVGSSVLTCNVSGCSNIGLGYLSLGYNTGGCDNVGIGYFSLRNTTVGQSNIAIGRQALVTNVNGGHNIAMGCQTLYTNSGGFNIALGLQSLYSNTAGGSNIAIGCCTLWSNSTGSYNIGVGNSSLNSNTTGCHNIAMGCCTLEGNLTGCHNYAFGELSMKANTSGCNNIAMGYFALCNNSTGNDNIALGYCALRSNNGSRNIAMGCGTMFTNSSGNDNIAIGYKALCVNSTGCNNIAMGTNALTASQTQSNNIALGYNALVANVAGYDNIAIGCCTLDSNTTGYRNIAMGTLTLQGNGYGCYNVAIGHQANGGGAGSCNSIFLGTCAGYSETGSDKLHIANTNACTLICGDFAGKTVTIDGALTSTGDMTATDFVLSSDCRLKTNIYSYIPICLDVEYKRFELCTNQGQPRYGVIAQELNITQPELVRCDNEGIMSVSYIDLLVREVAYLKNKVEELEKKIG